MSATRYLPLSDQMLMGGWSGPAVVELYTWAAGARQALVQHNRHDPIGRMFRDGRLHQLPDGRLALGTGAG